MRIRYILLFIMLSQASFSQVTLPPFYGLFAEGIPPAPSGSALLGGNAICDGTQPTTVVPITSSTGRVWMDRNLGASRAATSSTDYEAYGCLYQWGRGNDGHASITWTSSSVGTPVNGSTVTRAATDTPLNALFILGDATRRDWRTSTTNILWQGLAGINNPCPAGYRLPSDSEYSNEFTAYAITNIETGYTNGPGSGFKLVLAGYRSPLTANLSGSGSNGNYWHSTVENTNAINVNIYSTAATSYGSFRANGFSVRCIK